MIPRVSVILPCYNGSEWIDKTIRSILAQTYQKFELLIIDDGSTDDSRCVITPYLSDERVRYYYQENRGISATKNRGIKQSRGEFIGFIGQDDLWMPNKLKEQVDYLDENENVDLVHSNFYFINNYGKIIRARVRKHPKRVPETVSKEEYIIKLFLKNFICHETILIRRNCFHEVDLFDENMLLFADHDLWIRLAGKFNIAYTNEPLALKRIHKGQISKVKIKAGLKDEFLMLKKSIKQYPFLKNYLHKKKATLYFQWGLACIENWEIKEAREKFLKSLKYDPWNFKVHALYSIPRIFKIYCRF